MFNEGDVVFYVPSWDAEYKHLPEIGSVIAVRDYSIQVSASTGTRSVPNEWAAHVNNVSEILNLIQKLNKDLIAAQHIIYCVTALSDGVERTKTYKHYHYLA